MPGRKIDSFEVKVRFTCGALAGLFGALYYSIRVYPVSLPWLIFNGFVSVLVCGFGAVRYGDSFWKNLRWWI